MLSTHLHSMILNFASATNLDVLTLFVLNNICVSADHQQTLIALVFPEYRKTVVSLHSLRTTIKKQQLQNIQIL